jgi:peptidoglycan/xylan/chitin deacetylase (PgdA/CDA1 family)
VIIPSIRLALLAAGTVALAGCRGGQPAGHVPASAGASTIEAAVPKRTRPDIDEKTVRPNEVGQIPVLMYHAVGGPAVGGRRYDRYGLNIAPETFRKHLRLMHEAGWFPINMRDALSPRMEVPAGKIPVVLTFDDARGSQFRYLKDGSLDPDCAVAILEEFHAEYGADWPLKGSFYVLPLSKYNPTPFYQTGQETKKLRYLVERGFELANHSTSHNRMDRMDAKRLQWEMAECIRYVKKRAPEATMDTMALPMGYVPKSDALLNVLLKGEDNGTAYENKCILRAWGGSTLPPTHRDFNPKAILRIGCAPGEVEGWVKRLRPNGPIKAYVSDGDPEFVSVPKTLEKLVAKDRLDGADLFVWNDAPARKAVASGKVSSSRLSGR